jgi:two-component system chemotaxis response regulator CheY
VLSDWNMPEMDGLQFVKALRANPKFANVVVVMVTTETHIEQMMTALEAGANEYIMKPFTAEMVEDKLRMLQVVG